MTRPPIIITLDALELELCWNVAGLRQYTSTLVHTNNRRQVDASDRVTHYMGTRVEQAFATWKGLCPPFNLALRKWDFIYKGHKTDTKGTPHRQGMLFCRDMERSEATRFVLGVIVAENQVVFPGWATREMLEAAPFTDFGHPDKPAVRAIAQKDLNPWSDSTCEEVKPCMP